MFKMLELIKIVEKMTLLAGLLLCSFMDIRKKEISVRTILMVFVTGVLFFLTEKSMGGSREGKELLAGVAVGIILLLAAKLSAERIGYGDGLLFVMTGIFEGFWNNLYLLFLSSVLAGIAALFFLIIKKKRKTDSMPFAPFVLTGYVIWLLTGGSWD